MRFIRADETRESMSMNDEDKSTLAAATEWLRDALSAGPMPQIEIRQQAIDAGHRPHTLYRAKEFLGVKLVKGGFNKGWHWMLPNANANAHSADAAEDVQNEVDEQTESLSHGLISAVDTEAESADVAEAQSTRSEIANANPANSAKAEKPAVRNYLCTRPGIVTIDCAELAKKSHMEPRMLGLGTEPEPKHPEDFMHIRAQCRLRELHQAREKLDEREKALRAEISRRQDELPAKVLIAVMEDALEDCIPKAVHCIDDIELILRIIPIAKELLASEESKAQAELRKAVRLQDRRRQYNAPRNVAEES